MSEMNRETVLSVEDLTINFRTIKIGRAHV